MGRPFARFLGLVLGTLALTAPADAQWLRAESPGFVLYSQGTEERLRERIARLEQFHDLLAAATSVEVPAHTAPFPIYLVGSAKEIAIAGPRRSGVTGYYNATPGAVFAVANEHGEASASEVLFHEYAHHFMMRHAPAAYPAWYVEGFAEFFMTAAFEGGAVEIGRASKLRAEWLGGSSTLGIEEILFPGEREWNAQERARFYAMSWLLVHFFQSDEGRRAALAGYLAAINRGEEPRAAFEAHTGFTAATMEAALEEYRAAEMPVRRIAVDRAGPSPEIAVARLPESADDLLLYESALHTELDFARGQALLRHVRAEAARHPPDPYARRVLALAEIRHGDRARGEALLDPLLAAAPGEVGLAFAKGLARLRAGDPAGARTWFARARLAAPDHVPALYWEVEAQSGTASHVAPGNAETLLRAQRLAPEVPAIRLRAAEMLMKLGRTREAAALLVPLASDPHQRGLARTASAMLAEARGAAKAAPAAPSAQRQGETP